MGKAVKMNVELLAHTALNHEDMVWPGDMARVVAISGKICHSPKDVDLLKAEMRGMTNTTVDQYNANVLASGHDSILEHVSFTFLVSGVSRALLAQLTRHRIASFSVQSQRYVAQNGFDYVIPPAIASNPKLKHAFEFDLYTMNSNYEFMVHELIASGRTEQEAREDARFLLPNAAATQLVVTMNARELKHFFSLRCCNRAQWEIRALADRMRTLVLEVEEGLFKDSGAPCQRGKPCPEGTRSCGHPRSWEDNNG